MEQVAAALESVGCGRYAAVFRDNGYDDIETVAAMDRGEFKSLGVSPEDTHNIMSLFHGTGGNAAHIPGTKKAISQRELAEKEAASAKAAAAAEKAMAARAAISAPKEFVSTKRPAPRGVEDPLDDYNVGVTLSYVRSVLKGRAGGIAGLARVFRLMDSIDGNNKIDKEEFRTGLKDYGVSLSADQFECIFKVFDANGDGVIGVNEFMRTVAGPMPKHRQALVDKAFEMMDRDGSGQLTIDDIRGVYLVDQHPAVKAGSKTADEVLKDYINNFQKDDTDGIVTKDEFRNYYAGLSASIADDHHFQLMMKQAYDVNRVQKKGVRMG